MPSRADNPAKRRRPRGNPGPHGDGDPIANCHTYAAAHQHVHGYPYPDRHTDAVANPYAPPPHVHRVYASAELSRQ